MVLINALGVVIMMADAPTGVDAWDEALGVQTPTVEPQPSQPVQPVLGVVVQPAVVAEPQPAVVAEPQPVVVAAPQPVVVAEPPPAVVAEPQPVDTPPEPRWHGGPYFTLGFAPMATMDVHAHVHPGLRYDVETGMAWERGRARIYVGPDFHLMQYFGRKKPGFGVDAMTTLSLRHVYARVGAGTAIGIPVSADVKDTRPAIGGLVGAGLVGRLDEVEGRLGVDYDVRVDTAGRVAQTMLLTLRMTFGP